jgi:uncharacterized protein (TIGR02646 family)
MKKINKAEPLFYTNFIRNNNPENWDGCNEIKAELREYILKEEQKFQCAYCEGKISSDNTKSHIDHYKRKAGHLFPELQFDYSNLLVSCNKHYHCAGSKDEIVKKRDDYDTIINPVTDEPTNYFIYLLTGEIYPTDSDPDKAERTIEVFNLKHHSLIYRRREIALSVSAYKESLGIEEVINELGEFESFIRYVW